MLYLSIRVLVFALVLHTGVKLYTQLWSHCSQYVVDSWARTNISLITARNAAPKTDVQIHSVAQCCKCQQ
jgi:hypothetical protein